MGDTTTVRVSRATRDHVNRLAAQTGESVDAVIEQALRLAEGETRRRQAELEARRVGADQADRDEVRAAIRDALGE
jgi:predicted transcriptional regulator